MLFFQLLSFFIPAAKPPWCIPWLINKRGSCFVCYALGIFFFFFARLPSVPSQARLAARRRGWVVPKTHSAPGKQPKRLVGRVYPWNVTLLLPLKKNRRHEGLKSQNITIILISSPGMHMHTKLAAWISMHYEYRRTLPLLWSPTMTVHVLLQLLLRLLWVLVVCRVLCFLVCTIYLAPPPPTAHLIFVLVGVPPNVSSAAAMGSNRALRTMNARF